jgi:hypothetical protein
MEAHKHDMTLNEFVNKILQNMIGTLNSNNIAEEYNE